MTLVERLRDHGYRPATMQTVAALHHEAADEIERLTKALKECRRVAHGALAENEMEGPPDMPGR